MNCETRTECFPGAPSPAGLLAWSDVVPGKAGIREQPARRTGAQASRIPPGAASRIVRPKMLMHSSKPGPPSSQGRPPAQRSEVMRNGEFLQEESTADP